MKDFKKELQMKYTDMFGNMYTVLPKLNCYADNGNLYVGLDFFNDEYSCWEPYADVTVNICDLPFLESALDINNNGSEITDFLVQNELGELTGAVLQSGFCQFPVFKFNEEKLKEIDPDFFKEYAKAHGVSLEVHQPLNEQITDAKDKSSEYVDAGNKVFMNFLDDSMEK